MFIKFKTRTGNDVAIQIDKIATISSDSHPLSGSPLAKNHCLVTLDNGVMVEIQSTCDEALALLQKPEVDANESSDNPIGYVLDVALWDQFDDPDGSGLFVFRVNGETHLRGTLQDCIEAREAFAVGCDQNGVAYTMTDLPEVTI